jgi:hypothetical protein
MDEAGDMLTLPPGLADIAENEEGGKMADTLRRKEWEREAKWRKMAKVVNADKHGGGMTFGFDGEFCLERFTFFFWLQADPV